MDATEARMDKAEQEISDREDKLMENTEAEKKRETKAKEHNLRIREISDSLKRTTSESWGSQKRKREKRGRRVL